MAVPLTDSVLLAALSRMGLTPPGGPPVIVPLSGGVSSDIVRVDLPGGSICIKCALPRLRVAADWRAPVDRNDYEAEWMRTIGSILPDAVPRVLGEDRDAGAFAMPYLDPAAYPVWKDELRDGRISVATASTIGALLASIHSYTSSNDEVRSRFATDSIFLSIRLEPYLLATAAAHPDCAAPLEDLVRVTRGTRKALVHGDISPKNILIGPRGPVLLDAECAWYGDPAFDLAFCLNHLLLKCLWRPQWSDRYLACFEAMVESYLQAVTWEPPRDVERRTARLLPGLLLARIDGKSPVEYIVREIDRSRVRGVARPLLLEPADALAEVRRAWERI